MSPQIFQQRIKSLTPEYSDFVFSDFTEEAVQSIKRSGFLNFDTQVMENGIFLYLTLFLHRFEFTEFVVTECHQSIENAKNITDIVLQMMPNEMVAQQTQVAGALDLTANLVKEKDRFTILARNKSLLNQYLYLKTSEVASQLIEKYLNMNPELVDQFKVVVGDIALGFYKKEDTVPLLQQELGIDPKNAALLGAEVLDLFEIISKPTWSPSSSSKLITHETQEVQNAILPELRTMVADMTEERSPVRSTFNAAVSLSDEPMYSSTQPALERPAPEAPSYSAPLYQTPKPNVDAPLEKPRWG